MTVTDFSATLMCSYGLVVAPNKGPRGGYESLFCLGDALKKNGASLALDAASFGVGLLPGGTVASAGIEFTATSLVGGIAAVHSAATAPSFNAGAFGLTLLGMGIVLIWFYVNSGIMEVLRVLSRIHLWFSVAFGTLFILLAKQITSGTIDRKPS